MVPNESSSLDSAGAQPAAVSAAAAIVRRSAIRPVKLVLLDVGGPIYDDASYARALLAGLRDLVGSVDGARFRMVYDRQRQRQEGSLRQALTDQFLGGGDRSRLSEAAARHWAYGPGDLHDDVLPTVRALAERYRLGVVANQRSLVREALARDGVAPFIDVWAISDDVGAEKPDPRIFQHALSAAGIPARDAVHVGNRLDTDVRGAHRVGLRSVWVLRGEAPTVPTLAQRDEPDAVIAGLDELPAVLSIMGGRHDDR